jgi:PAS domain S-box-containing protein
MSEVQFRSYVDSAPEGIFIADEKGYYTFVNDAACIMTGYTREELLSKNLVDVIFPEDIPKAGEHFQRIVTTGSASGELRFITRSGEVRWWVVKGVRLSPTRFLGFVSDTTYRKRIEDALRESEGKYRSLFNQSTEGICVHDLEGRIHDVNEMACTQSGYSREELLSRTVFDGHPGQSTTFPPKAEILRTWDQWAPGQRFVIEAEHQRKDGTVFPVEISMGVVQYGNEKAILALIKDITERKVAEEKLLETTEYLQNLFDYANAPIIVWDPEYVITRFNHAFEDLTLISEQEVLGQRLDIMFPEDSRDTSLHEIKKTLEGERWETVEIPILVKDGSVRMVLWNSANILDLHGRIISTIAQGVDITERKVVEEALQLKNFAIESSINAIAIADMAGNLTNVNTAFLSIWGYEHQQEVLGQSVLSFWKVPHEAQQVVDGIQAQGTWTGEMTGQRKDGTPIPVQLSANLIRDVSGMPVAMMGSFIDITERKQAEGTLHQANKKLNLLSSITRHDINNQLTVLRGYLAILEKKQPDPSLTEYFGKVSTAAQRISSMIQFTKEYENIGVNAPVWQDCKTAIETAAKQAPLGKVVVKNDLPDCTEVFSDPLIVKVFYNLMDNAVQHGGKITTIWFSFEECNCDHLIVCEDDGDGVPAEEKEKIFEKGYGKNTGMGLFLAREILDITGITIRETGEPGKGARFEMAVPKGMWRFKENNT